LYAEDILFPPRIELRTFSVLGRRDNHYTMGTEFYGSIDTKFRLRPHGIERPTWSSNPRS
ncbi:Uncharacterized protein APZ42_000183, partial [Daphnia magna]